MAAHVIRDVLAMGAAEESQEGLFTVLENIDSIYPHAGWYYVTCHCCNKKAKIAHWIIVCPVFNTHCPYPMVRDQTDGTIFTVFNKVGENFLDSAANKFANSLGVGSGDFPLGVIALVGRYFSFRIRLPDYSNEDPNLHNYRVVDMCEIEPTPELRNHQMG